MFAGRPEFKPQNLLLKGWAWGRELARQLRTLAAFAKDLGSVSSFHMVATNHL